MAGCRHLTLKTDEDDPNLEDPEVYWWCEKNEKYVSHRGCTIVPCRGVALNGCRDADFSDYFKKYGYQMAVVA